MMKTVMSLQEKQAHCFIALFTYITAGRILKTAKGIDVLSGAAVTSAACVQP